MELQRLDAVADITMGQAPEGESYNLDGEGLPLIAGAGDFGELHPEPKKFTTAPGKTCQAGDIILGIRATIGEKVVADGTYCLGRGVAGLRPKAGLDERYLWHWLTHATPSLAAKAKGATFKQVNREDVGELLISLPPLPEQRRIADILDKADALRAKRRAALAQLDTLTQSIFLDMFGDPATNPKGYATRSLTTVCNCYSGGTPSKRESRYWTGGLPWFSPKDLKQDDLFDSEDHINELVPSETSLKLVPPNTVAVVVRGMILAHTFPVSVIRVPATINQDLKALLPKDGIELDAQFLAHCLRVQSRAVLASVSESAHGTKRLDAEALAKIAVPLPSFKLQQEFSRRVATTEQCKSALRASLRQLDSLFASLQDRAFRRDLRTGSSELSGSAYALGR